jgi:hypothetical protein
MRDWRSGACSAAEREERGGDVAATTRDPDAIQKEIEQTRAELAETIDAIADRISPKRAASRGAQAVKAQVSSVFGGDSKAPASVLDASPDAAARPDPIARLASPDAAARTSAVRRIAEEGGGATYTGAREFAVARRLRTERVLLLVGAAAALGGLVVLRRSRS